MKITINATFVDALSSAFRIAPGKGPKPILSNVRLDARDGSAVLRATDLEVSYRVTVHADGELSCLLPPRTLAILREVNADGATIEQTPTGLTLRADRSVFTLSTTDASEFPQPQVEDGTTYKVRSAALREALSRTAFACDTQSNRFALGGVLFDFEASKITLVATDGRRLSAVELAMVGEPAADAAPTIVPARACHLLRGDLPGDGNEMCTIRAGLNSTSFTSGNIELTTRGVGGRFPRWRDVIPKDRQELTTTINAGPLLAAVKLASIVTDAESSGVDFAFTREALSLGTRAAGVGQSEINVPISCDGETKICLEPRYLAEWLRTLPAEDAVTVRCCDGDSAMVLEDGSSKYIVMPLAKD